MSPMIKTQGSSGDLIESIEITYRALRYGLGYGALLFPALLYVGGRLRGIDLQPSISDYYHTSMRDVFVSAVSAAGAGLLWYRGFSKSENHALNVAGILAILVVLIPTPLDGRFSIHGTCAILLFLALAYVAWFTSERTLSLIEDSRTADRYRRRYKSIAIAMVALPLLAAATISIWPEPGERTKPLSFAAELAVSATFGVFWLVKSHEIRVIQSQITPSRPGTNHEMAPYRSNAPLEGDWPV
jgi:hypothetical protein